MCWISKNFNTHDLVFQNHEKRLYVKRINNKCEISYKSMEYPYNTIGESKIIDLNDLKLNDLKNTVDNEKYLIVYAIERITGDQICYDYNSKDIII